MLFHSFKAYQTRVLLQDGSFIEPSNVFRIYIEKLFWEGEQKTKESEVDQPVSNRSFCFSLLRTLVTVLFKYKSFAVRVQVVQWYHIYLIHSP